MTTAGSTPSSATPDSPSPARRRSRRRKASSLERLDLYGIVACSAVAALFFTEPAATRFRAVDLAWSAGLAALVALAGSRAKRWSVIWLAGVGAAFAIGSVWAIPAALALALGGVIAIARKRNRILDAAIAALAVQSVLRFPDIGPHGLPSLLA
jgi:hypothetical protein